MVIASNEKFKLTTAATITNDNKILIISATTTTTTTADRYDAKNLGAITLSAGSPLTFRSAMADRRYCYFAQEPRGKERKGEKEVPHTRAHCTGVKVHFCSVCVCSANGNV